MQDPDERFGTAEIMQHPWFLIGLPPGWDQLNQQCLRKKAIPLLVLLQAAGCSGCLQPQAARHIGKIVLLAPHHI